MDDSKDLLSSKTKACSNFCNTVRILSILYFSFHMFLSK